MLLWYYHCQSNRGTVIAKKCCFFAKEADILKIKKDLVPKGKFSKIRTCILTYRT